MSILLKNGVFIKWDSLEFIEKDILVNKEKEGIQFIDRNQKIEITPDTKVIDCQGKFVTKSFALGHHHAYSALSRGMPAPSHNPTNFHEKLKYVWWQLDKALDKDMIRASAYATAIACAKDGVTFVIDHHASPYHALGSLDIIRDVFEEVGLAHLLCFEISDRDGKEILEREYEESDSYLRNNTGLIGLHASFTLEDQTLKKAAELVKKHQSGIHIHVAEDPVDQEITFQKTGKRVIDRLNDFGLLDSSKSILAHCIHLNKEEREILKQSKAWIVQNMESNLNNNVGFFNQEGLGERIMLGTDGMHSDMIRSAQYAYFAGQKFDSISMDSAYERMRNVHRYISSNSISGDGDNNLVVLNYDGPTELNEKNFLGHFIYGFHGGHVEHVISNGQLIVEGHRLTRIDENKILEFTREQGHRLWKKLSN